MSESHDSENWAVFRLSMSNLTGFIRLDSSELTKNQQTKQIHASIAGIMAAY